MHRATIGTTTQRAEGSLSNQGLEDSLADQKLDTRSPWNVMFANTQASVNHQNKLHSIIKPITYSMNMLQ